MEELSSLSPTGLSILSPMLRGNIPLGKAAQTTLHGDLGVRGELELLQLSTPSTPTITNIGTAGSTTYGYKFVATVGDGVTAASSEGTTTTGNATLTTSNYNTITWVAIAGATGYKVYRTTGGTTPPMLITTIASGATVTYNDTDKTSGSSETPATSNTTGRIVASFGGTLLDDQAIYLGTGNTVALLYETADANANALILVVPEGGATDVPVFIFGDASILNVDLGWFNGITLPTFAVVNGAGDAYVSLDSGDINATNPRGLYFKTAVDEDIIFFSASVTGTPLIYWDESEDQFNTSKGWIFAGACAGVSFATSAAIPLLLTNGQLVNISLTSQTVGATTLTIPDFASVVDEFTFKTKSQTMANKTLTAPVINGIVTTTGLTLPALTFGGTATINGQTFNAGAGDVLIATTGSGTGLSIRNTNAGSSGVGINLETISSSPLAGDVLGNIYIRGRNSANAVKIYGILQWLLTDPTSTSEDASLKLHLQRAGTNTLALTLSNVGALWTDLSVDTLSYKVSGTKVLGAQGLAVADATDATSVILRLNDLLARARAHGLIAT